MNFNYEYKVFLINADFIKNNPNYVTELLNTFGKEGWIINCSIGDVLIFIRIKNEYPSPEGIISKQEMREIFERVE
jgi:hypothetical protein